MPGSGDSSRSVSGISQPNWRCQAGSPASAKRPPPAATRLSSESTRVSLEWKLKMACMRLPGRPVVRLNTQGAVVVTRPVCATPDAPLAASRATVGMTCASNAFAGVNASTTNRTARSATAA
jgi:hypothetical protein